MCSIVLLSLLSGKHLDCGNVPAMTSLFLPLGDKKKDYSLTLSATVENKAGFSKSYSLTTQVRYQDMGLNSRFYHDDFKENHL